ncbi:hypothetical protein PSI23_02015 [Xenorhabdus sp. XENO-10]|uniref:Uncharacterized protein n=1 Tax=Xenorhabdus yunnanensis TaxID=3025878 RepID=A0ABT5LCB5_9GAMM|nr:hypothetical protein [Xenorhabdus yunnanensis]MDC9588118.1 hypothetical protein [Xenorhabdus yunnanensis]
MPNREKHSALAETGDNSTIIMEEKFYPEYQAKIKEVSQHGMLSTLNEIQQNKFSWYYEPIIGAMFSNRHATFIKTCDQYIPHPRTIKAY